MCLLSSNRIIHLSHFWQTEPRKKKKSLKTSTHIFNLPCTRKTHIITLLLKSLHLYHYTIRNMFFSLFYTTKCVWGEMRRWGWQRKRDIKRRENRKAKGKMRSSGELEGKIETGVAMDRNGKVNQREIHAFSCVFLAGICVYIYL